MATRISMKRLAQPEIDAMQATLSNWTICSDSSVLSREFTFRDFNEAFAFMVRISAICQSMDHHPDWSNSYNKVVITLTTHSAGGITALDFQMAKAIDEVFCVL